MSWRGLFFPNIKDVSYEDVPESFKNVPIKTRQWPARISGQSLLNSDFNKLALEKTPITQSL
jgi:hypothetical protein